ncbi:MBL fold metallo-hydrolase [Candidatus Woesearchaeota archaeon]|nr:MBL fold metallo-hydrolase [Candidatus Woesearchaeota archaeon]
MAKILDEVMKLLPEKAGVTDAVFEGANIVLYTKNMDFFLDNQGAIKTVVDAIKKRVELRADPEETVDPEKSKKIIEKILPEDVGNTNIIFDPQRSRVIIEAEKPGLVIGKGGELLKDIKKQTHWVPVVRRIPAIRSPLIENIRNVLYENSDYRRKFLHKVGKRIYEGWTQSRREGWIRITTLGAGRELGRSCFLLQTQESRVMLDCGLNVAAQGTENMFPYLDAPEFNIQTLDAVIISHAHLDHVGTLAYLFKMGYRGPVYMTAPTRDVGALLSLDYISLSQKDGDESIYSAADVKEMVKHTICLDYEEVTDITPDIRLTFYNAGHNLGSSLCHLHIGNGLHNFVYSLDWQTLLVLVDENENTHIKPIGEIIDQQFDKNPQWKVSNGNTEEVLNVKGWKSFVFNPKTLKTELKPITSFVRHPIHEKMYEVKTNSGRKLTVTASHSLFTAKDGQVRAVKTSELQEGDILLGTKQLPQSDTEPIIDLFEYKDRMRIAVKDEKQLAEILNTLDFTKIPKKEREEVQVWAKEHYSEGMYKIYIAKKHHVHPRRITRAFKTLEIEDHPRVGQAFPDKLKITPNFARFLGYYIAEGWPRTKDQLVEVSNTNIEILEDCADIIKQEFGIEADIRVKDGAVLFASKQLKTLLSDVLLCGKDAYEKRIPNELLHANKEVLSNFLYGYFSGDGGIRQRASSREIMFGSKSQELIQGICFMLLHFSIVPTLEYNKYSQMYYGHLYNAEKLAQFLREIGINNQQTPMLENAVQNRKWFKGSFDLRMPLITLSKRGQASLSVTPWMNAKSCSIIKLKEQDIEEKDFLLLDSDFLFDTVKTIKEVTATKRYVYDLRVDGYENFLAGEGFLFAHNSGDFNYETSNLLASANIRFPRLESVMMESTYGGRNDIGISRQESEDLLVKVIKETADKEGKVLMPVLGVGRSQEIMIVLERAMREGKIPKMPIYLQGMLWDVTAIHTAYPDFFNSKIKQAVFVRDENPFLSDVFKRVVSQKEMQEVVEAKGPFIVMATSGMLTGGASLSYFKHFAEQEKNALVLTCYQGVGSLGRRLEEGEREINFTEGGSKKQDIVQVKLKIHSIKGFSGHSNFKQLTNWIDRLEPHPKKVIIVHGEYSKALEFASSLYQIFRIETVAPKNLESVRLR